MGHDKDGAWVVYYDLFNIFYSYNFLYISGDAVPSGISLSESGDKVLNPEECYNKGKGYLLFINNFENSGEPRRKGKW